MKLFKDRPKFQVSKKAVVLAILIAVIVFQLGVLLTRKKEEPSFKDKFLGVNIDRELEKCLAGGSIPQHCWVKVVDVVFKEKGLEAAIEVVDYFYKTDPSFASACHDFGHILGEETYKLFEAGVDFEITPKAAFCSYGFYHGFMEALVSRSGDTNEAREFCYYVDRQLREQTPDASLQCFHGIGHGWVNVHDRPDVWGDDVAIAEPGLELCQAVSSNASELSRCATGVFNGIAIFYTTGEYNLSIREDDPLYLCKIQPEEFKDPCYLSMNVTLMKLTGNDVVEASRYLEEIANDTYAKHAMLNLAIPFGLQNINKKDHEDGIITCRSLEERLRIPCIQGYAFAFLEHGEPGKEYIKPISFCHSSTLKDLEKEKCLGYIYGYLAQWYPSEKAYQICESVEERDYCVDKVKTALKGMELGL